MQWSDFSALPYCVRIQSLWIDQLRQSLEKVSMLRSTKPIDSPPRPRQRFCGEQSGGIEVAFQFPSDLEVLFFPHHQPEVPIWTHDSDDNDSQRNQTAPRANPRSTGLALEQNGLLTTPWILGRLVPCGVRQNRVPSPDTQSWGTSAQ